jgi:D-arabinose 1-dehydrogenase-like Zn-dependent alcohol dehydrogenase
MRRWVLAGPRRLQLEHYEPAPVAEDACVIDVEAAVVCPHDTRVYAGQHSRLIATEPMVLGHEYCGRIVASGATGLAPGRRVAVIGSAFCRRCKACRLGRSLECPGFAIAAGGYQDRVAIPAEWCSWRIVALDDTVPAEVGAFLDTIACASQALARAALQPGDRMCISGGGFIAAILAKLAHAQGVDACVIADGPRRRRGLADLGIVCHPRGALPVDVEELDAIIDLSAADDFQALCGRLRIGARVVLMTGRGSARLSVETIYARRLEVVASFHCDLSARATAARAAPSLIPVVRALSKPWEFSDASAALESVFAKQTPRAHLVFR